MKYKVLQLENTRHKEVDIRKQDRLAKRKKYSGFQTQ